ncbi:MAG: HdeD family acid-resistance protein [Anaerolineales bacterium]|jgi:uncharacterized membrane protein HdeD (DUF308 family)
MNSTDSYQQSWATIVSSKSLHAHWKGMTILGVWFVLLGLLVIAVSIVDFIPVSTMMGAILLLAGVAQSTQALTVRSWRGFLPDFAFGLIYASFGIVNLTYPITGVAIATLLFIGFLVTSTVLKLILAAFLHPARGWQIITSAAMITASFIFLLMIIDISMPWVLGLLLGIELMLNAWWIMTLASISRTI